MNYPKPFATFEKDRDYFLEYFRFKTYLSYLAINYTKKLFSFMINLDYSILF